MKRAVISIILIFTILNISSFFIMRARAPKYTVYTGAVHYPPDYLYYLSYIAQGRDHWVLGENLKSAETTQGALVNWFYVLGGRFGNSIGMSDIITYQLLVIMASIWYLSASYFLFALCFPKQPMTRLIAWVLFLLSNAFPKITHTSQGWDFGFYYPFNNLGHPFVRLSNVPHHTLIQGSIMAAFAFTLYYWKTYAPNALGMLILLGMILGTMQPLQWVFTGSVIGVYGLVLCYAIYTKQWQHPYEFLRPLLPAVSLCIIGFPGALYIQHLYSGPLYQYMLAWEKNQHVFIPIIDFIRLHGPVVLIGLLGIPITFPKTPRHIHIVWVYSGLALAIFFSPIPQWIGVLNLRFLSVLPIFVASYATAELIRRITKRASQQLRYPLMWTIAFLIIAITIPVTYAHVALGRPNAKGEDVLTYLPIGAFQIYETAKYSIDPQETTLVTPLFTQSFPAFTGRHVYEADVFGTIDFARKHAEAQRFWSSIDPPDVRANWLRKQDISYVFTYAWTPISDMQNLTVVSANDYAILYKVRHN